MTAESGTDESPSGTGVPDPTAATADGIWVRLRSLWRFVVVVQRFLPLVVTLLRDRRRFLLFGRSREVDEPAQRRRAESLLATLLDLGPTFIKFGQMLSTRPDVLPGPYVDVLSRLQDEVPPDDWEQIEPILSEEVGPVAETFDSFDREPISGASLGQVYTARLDGERVAVKVLRPSIRELVAADLRVLSVLMPVVVRFAPPGQSFTLENLADEFADTIRREMDYERELAALETVRENFADDDGIRIPRTLAECSTDRVLTMEYVDGAKITDTETIDEWGLDRSALVRRLEEAYIRMIIEDGHFHADPHPGNLAVKRDGTIVFYDFGMTGTLDPATRDHLFEFYVAIAAEDIEAIIDSFVALDALDPDADRELMREVFGMAIDQFRGGDVSEYRIQEFVSEFESELYDFPMRLPQNLALVVRVSSVLEGVCRTLDPEFDFIAVVTDYVRSRQGSASGAEWLREEATDRARDIGRASLSVPPALETAVTTLDTGNLGVEAVLADDRGLVRRTVRQVALGALVAATMVAVSLLYAVVGAGAAALASVAFLPLLYLLWRSFRRSRTTPTVQFTRHEMRRGDRDGE
jgi:predicted unusual protein kinase regulating ubiquinone biosynthesis (AarF/ABC1/UbiB family)